MSKLSVHYFGAIPVPGGTALVRRWTTLNPVAPRRKGSHGRGRLLLDKTEPWGYPSVASKMIALPGTLHVLGH
jgi:hypothetical protein